MTSPNVSSSARGRSPVAPRCPEDPQPPRRPWWADLAPKPIAQAALVAALCRLDGAAAAATSLTLAKGRGPFEGLPEPLLQARRGRELQGLAGPEGGSRRGLRQSSALTGATDPDTAGLGGSDEARTGADAASFGRRGRSLLSSTYATVVFRLNNGCLQGGLKGGAAALWAACTGAANQNIMMASDGTLVALDSGLCLARRPGTPPSVGMAACNGQDTAQIWNVAADAASSGLIKNKVDLASITAPTTLGGPLSLTQLGSGIDPAQQWTPVGKSPDVLTRHIDGLRTAASTAAGLTYQNVSPATFGRLGQLQLDGQVYAGISFAAGVPAVKNNGAPVVQDLCLTATMNNTVYAFNPNTLEVIYQTSLGTPINIGDFGTSYHDITGTIGVLSQPVIDRRNTAFYVVSMNRQVVGGQTSLHFTLHVLDLRTGAVKKSVEVTGSVAGTGLGSSNGVLAFNPKQHIQRPALTLANNKVYVTFGSHSDQEPYHGWIFSYAVNSLAQGGIFCTTPNTSAGSIWSAQGLVTDGATLWASSGNLKDGATVPEWGSKSLRIVDQNGKLQVTQSFLPANWQALTNIDSDYGMWTMGVPNTNLLVAADKGGTIYVFNRDSMALVQSWKTGARDLFSAPAFYNNVMYVHGGNVGLAAYALKNGMFNPTPTATTADIATAGPPFGGDLAISGAGTSNPIVWDLISTSSGPKLAAYNANTLAKLWDSTMNAGDGLTAKTKFAPPVIAGNKVFAVTGPTTISSYGVH